MLRFKRKVLHVAILNVVIFDKYEPYVFSAHKVYVGQAVCAFKVGLLPLLVSYFNVLLCAKSSLFSGFCNHPSECVATAPISPPRVRVIIPQYNAKHVVSNLHFIPSEAWESDFNTR